MAIVHYNPIIDRMSKKTGNLVFYTRCGTHCVRRWVIPPNPRTAKQQFGRASFADAVHRWQALPEYKRRQWNAKALAQKTRGYSLFISTCLRERGTDIAASERSSFLSLQSAPLRFRSLTDTMPAHTFAEGAFHHRYG